MSAASQPSSDRPLLRLFTPPEISASQLTIRFAYEEYLIPDLAPDVKDSTKSDYARWIGQWEEYEQWVAQSTQIAQPTEQSSLNPRMAYPWVLTDISSRLVSGFSQWLLDSRSLSKSTAGKAQNLIKRVIELAAQEGHKVNPIKVKTMKPAPAAKHYIDDLQMACLWLECDAQSWPPQKQRRTFAGSGMSPATFWRCVLIMLRCYGMRVQDLVSYQKHKEPILWRDITLTPRSPNPEGRVESPLGWLHYVASKTGREYYLPLTPITRVAIDRLRAAAIAAIGPEIPPERPILPCPAGHGLTDGWKLLQARARVSKPSGEHYDLEDFRKTCATYLDEYCDELAYHVCGWSTPGSKVAHKHYINSERKLVAKLPDAPIPNCFRDWLPPIAT